MNDSKPHIYIEVCKNSAIVHIFRNKERYWFGQSVRFKRPGTPEKVLQQYEEWSGRTKDDYVLVETLRTAQIIARNRQPIYQLYNKIRLAQESISDKGIEQRIDFEGEVFTLRYPHRPGEEFLGVIYVDSPPIDVTWVKIGEEIEFRLHPFKVATIRVSKFGDVKLLAERYYSADKYSDEEPPTSTLTSGIPVEYDYDQLRSLEHDNIVKQIRIRKEEKEFDQLTFALNSHQKLPNINDDEQPLDSFNCKGLIPQHPIIGRIFRYWCKEYKGKLPKKP